MSVKINLFIVGTLITKDRRLFQKPKNSLYCYVLASIDSEELTPPFKSQLNPNEPFKHRNLTTKTSAFFADVGNVTVVRMRDRILDNFEHSQTWRLDQGDRGGRALK